MILYVILHHCYNSKTLKYRYSRDANTMNTNKEILELVAPGIHQGFACLMACSWCQPQESYQVLLINLYEVVSLGNV